MNDKQMTNKRQTDDKLMTNIRQIHEKGKYLKYHVNIESDEWNIVWICYYASCAIHRCYIDNSLWQCWRAMVVSVLFLLSFSFFCCHQAPCRQYDAEATIYYQLYALQDMLIIGNIIESDPNIPMMDVLN